MAGKSFAILEYDGEQFAIAVEVTGFSTDAKFREVPEAYRGGTMRKEPTGGVEYVDGQTKIQELEDEGLSDEFMKLWVKLDAASKSDKIDERRKSLSLVWYSDAELTKTSSRLDVSEAMPMKVGPIEFDKASDDPREFTVDWTHAGSAFKKAGA
jgi:hypothetical protein